MSLGGDGDSLEIGKVLTFYGASLPTEGAGWRKMHCFNTQTHEDKTQSGSINFTKGLYKCFGCGIQGNALKIIQLMEGIDYDSSISRYEEITGDSNSELRAHSARKRSREIFGDGKRDYERGHQPFSSRLRRGSDS